ncbi:MAG: mechanosensitive ion channel domain-containing protein [bacterium]
MRSKENLAAVVLLVLLAIAGYGLVQTGGDSSASADTAGAAADSSPTVDQGALASVQLLIRMPTTAEELPLAQDALRLADQDMDLAFADAVREVAAHPQPVTAEAKLVSTRLQRVLKELIADQAQVAQLTAEATKANGLNTTVNDQLDLAKARLELDQDDADDAKEDLIHAGGDPQGRLQAMVQDHEAASKSSDSIHVTVTATLEENGLVRHAQAYWQLQDKRQQLRLARAAAETASVVFSKRHHALDADAAREGKTARAASPAVVTAPLQNAVSAESSHEASAALLLVTQRKALEQKARASLEQRGDNQRKLVTVFRKWSRAVRAQQRSVMNHALRELVLILAIAIVGLFSDKWVGHVLGRLNMERRSRQRLHAVFRVSMQVVGVILILIVIFGVPSNLGTIIGLAGAGLTVALKDFIVGFVGWLVLMGKNGIRIGDLVEINGVTGEVAELGMFNTVLLETGNWTDAGHPTGRRVTFTNSYAIEGHYFNFSTSGQWLWDEVRIVVPNGRDPSPVIEALQAHVETATADSSRLAQEEWKGASRSPVLSALTAAPAITIKPIMGGLEVTLRYITHAAERYQLRSKLYGTAVGVLSGPAPVPAPT